MILACLALLLGRPGPGAVWALGYMVTLLQMRPSPAPAPH